MMAPSPMSSAPLRRRWWRPARASSRATSRPALLARASRLSGENNEANRQAWRNLLFTTDGIGEYISGAILFEETLFQNDPVGKPFVDVLKGNNIIPGIKVDTGLRRSSAVMPARTGALGLDSLAERCAKYYVQGARFAKWRTALKIDVEAGCPTDLAIDVAAQDLARYARICQENSLSLRSLSPRSSSTAPTTSRPPRACRSACCPPST